MSLLSPVLRPRAEAPVPYVSRKSGSSGSMFGGGKSSATGLGLAGHVGTVFSIVSRITTAVAAQEWALYRSAAPGAQVQDEDRQQVTTHAAAALWAEPNPFMTTADLVEIGQQHIELAPTGDTFLVVVKAGGIPIELWPVRPDRMTPRKHPTKFLLGWNYKTPDGEEIPLDHDEVIQVVLTHDPEDPYRGISPARSLGVELAAYTAAAEWNANFFRNSAEPGGIIEVPSPLSDDQFNELSARWAEQHRGTGNAHRVAILEHGRWVDRKYSMRDMQFNELRQVGRDTIMEAWGISRASLGVTDGVNFAAAKAADLQFAKLITQPRLRRWQQALNTRLLPMFGATGKGVEFDFASPLPDDEEAANAERAAASAAAEAAIRMGFNAESVKAAYHLPAALVYGSGEKLDPDRELMMQLVTAAPAALGPLLLPILLPDVEFPAAEPAPAPAPAPPAPAPDDPEPVPAAPQNRALPRAEGAPDVDLRPVQEAYERHLARLLDQIDDVRATWRGALRAQIRDAIDDGDLAALGRLELDPAPAAARIVEAMRAIGRDAAEQVRREAAAQGVTLALPARVTATAGPVPDDDVAATLAALMAAAEALSAGSEAMRINYPGASGDQVAGQVDAELRTRTHAQDEAQLGGILTGAQNRARVDTMAGGPVGALYADETLDGNTCGPCRRVDGRYICDTDDLAPYERLYTAVGGYVDCDGRARCRGTVTGVWRPETAGGDRE